MTSLSPLQQERSHYIPKLPTVLSNLRKAAVNISREKSQTQNAENYSTLPAYLYKAFANDQ